MAASAEVETPTAEPTEPRAGRFAAVERVFDRVKAALRSVVDRFRKVGTATAPAQPDPVADPGERNPATDAAVQGESTESSGVGPTAVTRRRILGRRFAAAALIAIACAVGIAGVWLLQRKSAMAGREAEELRARLDAQTRELARTRRALEASETARAAAGHSSAPATNAPPARIGVSQTDAPAPADIDCSVSGANAGETLKRCIEMFNRSMR